jgi:alpha-galactosidase
MDLAQRMVAYYKKIRGTVQTGQLYRLREPEKNAASANEYVSADGKQAVVFAFLHAQNFGTPFPTLNLQGLDPNAKYRITALDQQKSNLPAEASGNYLMHFGITPLLRGDYDSTSILLEKVQ